MALEDKCKGYHKQLYCYSANDDYKEIVVLKCIQCGTYCPQTDLHQYLTTMTLKVQSKDIQRAIYEPNPPPARPYRNAG
jgi:flavoprotein